MVGELQDVLCVAAAVGRQLLALGRCRGGFQELLVVRDGFLLQLRGDVERNESSQRHNVSSASNAMRSNWSARRTPVDAAITSSPSQRWIALR